MELKRAKGFYEVDGRNYRAGEFLPFYVPRDKMPQVDEKDLPRLIADVLADGLSIKFDVTTVNKLRAHQRIDRHKAMKMPAALLYKPLLVSMDEYILDGNHRWLAHVLQDVALTPVFQIDCDFDTAIEWLKARPYVYEITPGTPERN